MAQEQTTHISVIDPLGPAFERVKVILFKPFDLGKWFVIGFCAWLAGLGENGGGGGGGRRFRWEQHADAHQLAEQAKDFVLENLFWIIPATIFVILLITGLWLLVTWLSSRGRFMFLHCVAQNKAEVKVPWSRFRRHANSLFLFRIIVGLIALAAFSLPCLLAVFFIFAIVSGPPYVWPISGLGVIGLAIFVLIIAFWLVKRFTTDFVMPIMFLGTTSCTVAWRQFLTILSANKARFALYALFRIVIAIAIGVIVIAVVLVTCCCALCIFAIPYIGTVVFLPVLVFVRAYSLCYFRQFGPQFDVFTPEAEVTG
ncbi:MAG: hypothetical protein ACETVZ_06445 [Phycisphaerae bacterium]